LLSFDFGSTTWLRKAVSSGVGAVAWLAMVGAVGLGVGSAATIR
jgi:hypothetical protein